MAKSIRCFLESWFEYFLLKIVVNVNFFSKTKTDGTGQEIFSEKVNRPWNI